MDWLLYFVSILSILIIGYFFLTNREGRPGPWGFFILGHLPRLGRNPGKTLLKWKNIYGPIYFIRFGSTPAVVISDFNLLKELLNLPATSGRLYVPYAEKVLERKGIILAEGPELFEQRQFSIKTLKEFGYGKIGMEQRIEQEISQLLVKLEIIERQNLKFKVKHFFNLSVINALWEIMMGARFNKENEADGLKLVEYMDKLNSTESLVEQVVMFFPWMTKILEFLGISRNEKIVRNLYTYFERQIQIRKQTWVMGQPRDFTDAYFDKIQTTHQKNSSFHYSQSKVQMVTTGDIFITGIETVSTTLEWLMLHMAVNLNVQKKLQHEIDQIVGPSRLPSLTDRPQMIYTQAVISELLRISALVPLAVPHRALEDFNFRGHLIKKDTMIVPNLYSVHLDPQLWPDPMTFKPERFIVEGQLSKKMDNFLPFGTGKRACLGEVQARDQLFLYCTSIFQKFNLSVPNGVQPSFEPMVGMSMSPRPFELVITKQIKKIG